MNTSDQITSQAKATVLFCGVHLIGSFMISIAIGTGAGALVSRIISCRLQGALNAAHDGFNLMTTPWARLFKPSIKTPINKTYRDAATQTPDEFKDTNDPTAISRDSSSSTVDLYPADADTQTTEHKELSEFYDTLTRDKSY